MFIKLKFFVALNIWKICYKEYNCLGKWSFFHMPAPSIVAVSPAGTAFCIGSGSQHLVWTTSEFQQSSASLLKDTLSLPCSDTLVWPMSFYIERSLKCSGTSPARLGLSLAHTFLMASHMLGKRIAMMSHCSVGGDESLSPPATSDTFATCALNTKHSRNHNSTAHPPVT